MIIIRLYNKIFNLNKFRLKTKIKIIVYKIYKKIIIYKIYKKIIVYGNIWMENENFFKIQI